MKRWRWLLCAVMMVPMFSQAPVKPDPFAGLSFLEGTWYAKGTGDVVLSVESYTFQRELDGHVLARHSNLPAACREQTNFDCKQGDLLYVYQEAYGEPLKAIYFASTGLTLHYDVTTPAPATAVFLTESSPRGARIRLVYELRNGVMTGKLQVQASGSAEWRSYFEWSGGRAT